MREKYMNKKVRIVMIIIMIGILGFVFYLNTDSIAKSKVLYAVYNNDCNVIQANVSTWSALNEELYEYSEMKSKVEEFLKHFDIKGKVEVQKNESDSKIEYIVTRNAKDVETTIKIETNKIERKSNLYINIIVYNNIDGVTYVQNKLEELYKKHNLKYKMNITLAGRYNKKYDKDKYKSLAGKIFRGIKAKKINDFETDKIYSLYGYTDYIGDYVMVNGKKTNVNVALRYNEYEDETYLYVATPIITTDY